jgi:hypothetical protein
MKIRVFTVFHKILDESIWRHFSPAEKSQWFVAYAVNDKHPKRVIDQAGISHELGANISIPSVVEYDQVAYFPQLQQRGFMETSCYVHVHANNLADDVDYVGVCQYDMRWTEEAVSLLRSLSALPPGQRYGFGLCVGTMMAANGEMHPLAFTRLRNWQYLLDHDNRFFSTDLRPGMLVNQPFTLFQTYLLPKKEFLELAGWLRQLCDDVYPWACSAPYETHWGSLGGYTERAASLFFAARVHAGQLSFRSLPLDHDESIAESLGIEKGHYG